MSLKKVLGFLFSHANGTGPATACPKSAAFAQFLALLVGSASTLPAANIIHEFYVPMPEAQVRTALVAIEPASGIVGTTMESVVSIVVTGAGTVVHYDEWEDGYEIDINNPTQSTTKIWGDGNNANGIPPGYANDPASFPSGAVINMRNQIPLPRNPANILYDGRDRFGGTKALVVTRTGWAVTPGTVLAGSVEVTATMDYGTSYISPVGQDVSANQMFEVVGLMVLARENGTSVTVDLNGPVAGGATTVTLNQGESHLVASGVLKGATVTSTKPVQVQLITGDIGARYETDWFTLYPVDQWTGTYYSPVGTAADGDASFAFLYNPTASSISIDFVTSFGTGSFSVPAYSIYQHQLPQNSGTRFTSVGEVPFFGIVMVGANPTANNVHDWGFTLVPSDSLTTEAVVGWGPGSSDLTQNGSPVWVTPTDAARIYVDYNGDRNGSLTDPKGNKYDVHYDMNALETRRIFDPDKDQSAMRVYTLDGIQIAAAWGQDPATAGPGNPFLDVGTTVLPFPVPTLVKSFSIVTDTAPFGLSIGDTLEYRIDVDNKGLLPLGNLLVLDPLNPSLTYVAGTTTRDGGSIPDDGIGSTIFPLDETGYVIPIILRGGNTTFTYRCTINAAGSINNTASNTNYNLISTTEVVVPPPAGSTPCGAQFTTAAGVPQSTYSAGTSIYSTMTDPDANNDAGVIESITVVITNTSNGDAEFVTLVETGVNTGVFRNTTGLPTSTASGSSQMDGTLLVSPGNSLSFTYTDPEFNETCSGSATISVPTQSKFLYLSDPSQALDRVDPVAASDGTTASTSTLSYVPPGVTVGTTTSGSIGNASSLTISHTTGSGANRLLLVTVAIGSGSVGGTAGTVSGVTYGGTGMTQVGTAVASGGTPGARVYIFSLLNPPSGVANVIISTTAGSTITAGATSFENVDQTTPMGTFASNPGASGNPSLTVTSATNETVVSVAAIDEANNPQGITTPGTQTQLWNVSNLNYVSGAASTKAGAASVSISYTSTDSTQEWVAGGVPVKPASGGGATTSTFLQTPTFASTFTLPVGGTPSVTAHYTVSSGSMPANPTISAILKNGGSTIATSTATTASAATGSGFFTFTFSALGSAVNFAVSEALTLEIRDTQSGVAFTVDFDSITKPSKITLPTTTVITNTALGVYDAPYPGGSLITGPASGSTVYVRATASDPFGNYDITSMGLSIDGPGAGGDISTTLHSGNVVNTTAATKTYEYAWAVGSTVGTYNIATTANEGTEGINATRATSVNVTFLDLGTPSVTEFTTGANGPGTTTYAGNEQVCVRITDLDQNLDALVAETITATITSLVGDSELVTLTETGVNTGIFVFCIPASTTAPNTFNNGTLHAILGDVLTVNYVDQTDPTDTGADTATIPNIAPAVSVNKTLVTPADGQAVVGEALQYTVQVTNTGNTTLNTISLVDTFPTADLTFVNANVAPSSTLPAGTLTWNNVGPLAPGQSVTRTLNFTALSTAAPAVNSATADAGGGVNSTDTADVTITDPKITITKTLLSPNPGPANIGDNVVFRIAVQNTGDTAIATLPVEDTYSGADFDFVSATVAPDASGSGSLLWLDVTGAGNLAVGNTITIDVTLRAKGAAAPAINLARADYTVDVNGDPAPPVGSTATITLIAAKISGHVYDDANTNGAYNPPGDSPLENITVSLYTDPNGDGNPADGVLIDVTTTDVNGAYEFLNLPTGNYVVVESQPPGYSSHSDTVGANDNRIPLVINTLTTFANNDFFDFLTPPVSYASIAGKVWNDANASATVNGGEVGIENVPVDLVEDTNNNGVADPGEPVTASTLTAADGTYSFGGLSAGNYVVVEHDLFGWYSTADTTAPNNNMIPVVLTSGANVTGRDFLDVLTGTTGGKVFHDVNGNGSFDGGDVALANIDVLITDSLGATQTVVTDASGNWTATVPPGLTTIDVQQSDPQFTAIFTSGHTQTAGADPNTITAVSSVNTAAGDDGFRQVGTVTGHLYVDTNGDGDQDVGEPDLAGVDVVITDVDNNTQTVVTNASGNWTATVPPGSTSANVSEADPQFTASVLAGYTQTQGTDPNSFTAVANTSTNGGTDGYFNPATISGVVSKDTNNDGTADAPQAGVQVRLFTDPNGDGNPADGVQQGAPQTTNGSGAYSFTGLTVGSYVVVMTTPSGYAAIDDGDTTTPGDDAANASVTDARIPAAVTGGETDTGNNFLIEQYGTISGTVLSDLNNDNTGDDPIGGVTLTLVDSAGNPVDGDPNTGGVQPITTTTDGNGDYGFSNVPPGTYGVKETQPITHLSVTDTDGGDPNEVRPITLTAGGTSTADFVEEEPATINGTVLADTDNDDIGDTGIFGVTLTLLDINGDPIDGDPNTGGVQPITDTTDVNGNYSFTNLRPGSYQVSEAQPVSYFSLGDLDGGDLDIIGDVALIELDAGETDSGNDFIEEQYGTISGTVWKDTDNNDSGDTAFSGVVLTLLDISGAVIDGDPLTGGVQPITATTNASGVFTFSNIPPGDYRVGEAQPSGYQSVSDSDGGNLDQIAGITVFAGTLSDGYEFVEEQLGEIRGTVFKDVAMQNVVVALFTDPNGDGDPSDGAQLGGTVLTNASGEYVFTSVAPGTYVVVETQPAGYVSVTDGDTTTPGDDVANASTTDNRIPVGIAAGETDDGNNFVEGCPTITVNPPSLPNGTVGTAYSQALSATGGTAPYSFAVTTGVLPSGLSLVGGTISGTPTSATSQTFTITATDAIGCTGTRSYTIAPVCPTITVNPATLPDATVGSAYSQTLSATGGTAAYSFAVTAGTLPDGLTLTGDTISGTATTAGPATFTITSTDNYGCTGSRAFTVTAVCPTITVNPSSLPAAVVGTAYSQTLTATGGTAPFTYAVTTGVLPAGLALTGDTISGTPTSTTSQTFTVTVTDDYGCKGTRSFTLAPTCPAVSLASIPAVLPGGTVGTAYSGTITASGGTPAYTFAVKIGSSLPPGLNLSGAGAISGTPTTNGTTNTIIVATDANGCSGEATFVFNIGCNTLGVAPGSIADGVVGTAYTPVTFTSTGGTGVITWQQTGALPAGMTFNAGTATLSGTPTEAGTFNITIIATDANTCSGSVNLSFSTSCPTVIVNPATLPDGVVGTAYSEQLSATGGTAPYTFAVTSGVLPAGLTLVGDTISGTPTATTSQTFTITATDDNGCTGTRSFTLTPVCPTITVNPASLPDGVVGTAYNQTLSATDGTAPYTFAVTSGALPAGLNLSGGVISGTPTSTASATFTITATDVYGCTGTRGFTLAPTCPTITVNPSSLPAATVGTAYSQALSASGGTAAYTFAVTTGSLPAGLSLVAGVISGTPTDTVSETFTITATDAHGCTGTRSFTLAPACPTITVNPVSLPAAVVGTAYGQALSATGGTAPFTYAVTTGVLPAGLTLTGDTISGTPTSTTSQTFTITVTDDYGCEGTRSFTLAPTCPTISLASIPAVLPSGIIGAAYNGTITAGGGTAAYTFALKAGSSLPPGLNLAANGAISGTPTINGTTGFIIVATDANGCEGESAFTINIGCNTLGVAPGSLANGVVGTAYTPVTFTSTGGTGVITWQQTGALPAGMTFNTGTATLSGTPTEAGTFSITIIATDGNTCSGSVNLTFSTNCPSITVNPATLPDGVIGTAYSQTLSATGGTAPYAFALTSGVLPAGLSLTGDTISGTPTATTSQTFTITVTDDNGCTGARIFTLTTACPTIMINPATLPDPALRTAYSQTLNAIGGTAPYTFAVTTGALPAGLSLAGDTISGTPTAAGPVSFTVTATDSLGCQGTRSFSVTVLSGTISGHLYLDTNGDGGQDPGEPDLPNVNVIIAESGGATQTVSSDANGDWTATVPPGSTSVNVDETDPDFVAQLPPGFMQTEGNDPTSGVIVTAGGNADGGTDGYFNPADVRGHLYFDMNGDGVQQPGEDDLVDVTVIVTDSEGTVHIVMTDANGDWQAMVPPGSTTANVDESDPEFQALVLAGYTQTEGGDPSTVTAVAGMITSAGNDGYFNPGTISGMVLADTDNDDIGDAPLPGVTLTLKDSGGNDIDGDSGTPGVQPTTTTTNGGGFYSFNNLPPGTYLVYETQPGGYASIGDLDGGNPDIIGDLTPILVASGETRSDNDFVEEQPGEIRGTVFKDVAMENVAVALFTDPDGDGDPADGAQLGGTVLTNAGGEYTFTNVSPGDYVVVETQPAGYVSVTDGDTTTPGDDAANVSTTDNRIPVGIAAGETDDGNNFVEGCPTITVNPASLPNGTVGTAYSQTLSAMGSTAPYSFAVTSGVLPAGLSLVGDTISGTPTSTTPQTFTIRATDAIGCAGFGVFTVGMSCNTLIVTPGTIADPVIGQPYGPVTFNATGAVGPVTWAAYGGLPPGMSFNSATGSFGGTPTAGGLYSLLVVATDSNGCSGSVNFVYSTVCPTVTVNPASLPDPVIGVPYSQTLSGAGGAAPYTFVVTAFGPPPGLTLTGDTISGTATAPWGTTFAITAIDAYGCTGTRYFTLIPQCPAISVNPATLPDGVVGTAYNQTVSASGGVAPYSHAVTSGTLPAGLTLTGGTINGTPTSTTSQTFTITATDANNCTGTRSFTIAPACPGITVNPATLPDPALRTAYSQTLTALGGTAPYTFAVTSGELPAGLTLTGNTIGGTPTSTAGATFVITATDANGCTGARSFTVAVLSGTISGHLYVDANGDGDQDPGEPDLSGVDVVITESGGATQTAGTDANGDWTATVPPGSTSANVDELDADFGLLVLPGYTQTEGGDPTVVTAVAGSSTSAGIDGYFNSAVINGTVLADTNNDNTGDAPLSGVTLTLKDGSGNDIDSDSITVGVQPTTTNTDVNGTYAFTGLPSGNYQVVQTQPAGYLSVSDTDGGADNTVAITLPAAGTGIADFIEEQTGTIGNLVWIDENNNGIKDSGESGLDGVLVELLDGSGNPIDSDPLTGGVQPTTATTAGGGFYSFGNVAPGNYRLRIATPPALYPISSTVTDAADNGEDDDDNGSQDAASGVITSPVVAIAAGESEQTLDFGLVAGSTLGNLVWNDTNNDGIKDGGESGIDGVQVALLDSLGAPADDPNQAGVQAYILTTSGGGLFSFTNLVPGSYRMRISSPDASFPASSDVTDTSDNGEDDDDNGSQAMPTAAVTSPLIGLSHGETDDTVDFGFTAITGIYSISGQVRDDYDEDGNFSDNDTPVPNVTMKLYADTNGNGVLDSGIDQEIGSTTTDGIGFYQFNGLPSGTYFVEEVDPNPSNSTADIDGANDNIIKVVIAGGGSGSSSAGNDFLDGVDPSGYSYDVVTGQIIGGGAISVTGPGAVTILLDGSSGQYSFVTDGTPGSYTLSYSPPLGYMIDPARPVTGPSFDPTGGPDPTVLGSGEDPGNAGYLANFTAAGNPYYYTFDLAPGDPFVINNNIPLRLIKPTTYVYWKTVTPGGGPTPGSNGDGDCYADLLEYALCLNPTSGVQTTPAFRGVRNILTGKLDAMFNRADGGFDDVTYTVVGIADLTASPAGWTALSLVPTVTSNGDGTETVTFADLESDPLFAGLDHGFVRLNVVLDENHDTVPEATASTPSFGWTRRTFQAECVMTGHPYLKDKLFCGTVDAVVGNALDVTASAGGASIVAQFVGGREYFIEVYSGDNAGQRFEIDEAASTATSIALDAASGLNTLTSVPASLAGDKVVIREHWRLNEMFSPSQFIGTNNPSTGDRLLFYDRTTSAFVTYWLFANAGSPKWVLLGDAGLVDQGSRIMEPGEGWFTHPRNAAQEVVWSGMIRANQFACPLDVGANFIGSAWPMDQSPVMRGMSAGTGFDASNDPSRADQILFWKGDTGLQSLAYYSHFLLSAGALQQWTALGNAALVDENNLLMFHPTSGSIMKMRTALPGYVMPMPWTP